MTVNITDPLPSATKAEQGALGCVLLDSTSLANADYLTPDDFHDFNHGIVWGIMQEYDEIDYVTLIDVLTQRNLLKTIGEPGVMMGKPYITNLQTKTVSSARMKRYARQVRKAAMRRMEIAAGLKMIEHGLSYTGDDLNEICENAETQAGNVSVMSIDVRQPQRFGHVKGVVTYDLKERWDKPDAVGVKSGLTKVDDALLGFEKGAAYLIFGGTNAGKTETAMGLAIRFARQGKVPVVFSLEQPEVDLGKRIIQMQLDVGVKAMRSPREAFKTEAEFLLFLDRINGIDLPIITVDVPSLTEMSFRNILSRLAKSTKVDIVLLDWLGLMTSSRGRSGDPATEKYLANSVKQTARYVHLPIIALDQMNKDVHARKDPHPRLSDVQYGKENAFDAAIGLFPPWYYDPDNFSDSMIQYCFVKNRLGPFKGVVDLYRDPLTGFHGNLAPPVRIPLDY